MFDYFISYVIVPQDTTDSRRWGNSVVHTVYALDDEEAIRAIEKDVANQLEFKSITLMHWQPLNQDERSALADQQFKTGFHAGIEAAASMLHGKAEFFESDGQQKQIVAYVRSLKN